MIVMPATNGIEIVRSIQVYLISRMNINYKENGGKESFSCNPKYQYRVSQLGEYDYSDNNKKNGFY